VGYVGRDVESMVRDLVETSVRIVKEEMVVKVQDKAEEQANQRLVEILVPSPEKQSGFKNPLEMLFGGAQNSNQTTDSQEDVEIEKKRQDVERKLAAGLLEDEIVSIEVTEQQSSMFDMLQGTGMEQMGMNFQDALGSFMPKKTKKRKLSV
ncbi:ATP-dependent protease ATPase subunit HslU, partial [Bacillus cereus group sp. Bce025]